MDHATLIALTDINRRFYSANAKAFGDTRHAPWRGWRRVIARVQEGWEPESTLRVLDVGCGNGRFLRFLGGQWPHALTYNGVDFVIPAKEATESLESATSGRIEWEAHDFIVEPHPLPVAARGTFDLICLFGVLHHVPSLAARQRLLSTLREHLAPGGHLVLTLWQFANRERFRRRLVPWSRSEALAGVRVAECELEPGDFLLAWGAERQTARYCHHASSEEWHALTSALDLRTVDEFSADGETGDLNDYKVLVADGVDSP